MSAIKCAAIKKSKEELVELGMQTTYVVASRKDGQFCIVDANLIYVKLTYRPMPPLLPLHGKVYPDYQSAFGAIVTELTRETETNDEEKR